MSSVRSPHYLIETESEINLLGALRAALQLVVGARVPNLWRATGGALDEELL